MRPASNTRLLRRPMIKAANVGTSPDVYHQGDTRVLKHTSIQQRRPDVLTPAFDVFHDWTHAPSWNSTSPHTPRLMHQVHQTWSCVLTQQ